MGKRAEALKQALISIRESSGDPKEFLTKAAKHAIDRECMDIAETMHAAVNDGCFKDMNDAFAFFIGSLEKWDKHYSGMTEKELHRARVERALGNSNGD